MNTVRLLLWLIVLLIGFHCYTITVIFPEFHVLNQKEFQENLNKTNDSSPASKETVRTELIRGRWNGQYGQSLAKRNLAVDAVIFVIIGWLIIKSYYREGNESTREKQEIAEQKT